MAITKIDIVNSFICSRGYSTYLELCASASDSIASMVTAESKTVVSRDMGMRGAIHETSYDYFICDAGSTTHDLIYLDGVHMCEHAIHDLTAAVRHVTDGGVVVLHNCLPVSAVHATRFRASGAWTGDVWRAVASYLPTSDYLCYTIDADWGCFVVDTAHKKGENVYAIDKPMTQLNWDDYVARRDELLHVVDARTAAELSSVDLV